MSRGIPAAARNELLGTIRIALFAVVAASIAACEPADRDQPPPGPDNLVLTPASFDELPDWNRDLHAQALTTFLRSCGKVKRDDKRLGSPPIEGTRADLARACDAATSVPPDDNMAARGFFETRFQPFLVANNAEDKGLGTGYFEIELNGARQPDKTHTIPVFRPPGDRVKVDLGAFDPALAGKSLVGRVEGDHLKPYYTRGDIDGGVLDGRGLELVWLTNPVDAFMLHVQGSGQINLRDGGKMRIGFAAHNGRRYKSIGRELIRRGELTPDNASWPNIRAWVRANPDKAGGLLAVNKRYIFFQENGGGGPLGSQGVELTPGRSLAVDRRYIPLGLPLWLDTEWPGDAGRPLRRLMMAQDTGAAIRGPVRGDFYWGTGDSALAYAGRMKHAGRYYLLLPVAAAERMADG